jgi:Formate hydrogenlyase subunit 3/Multisubunit Na+/H+ antiporter, MnhD subunit
VNHWIIIPILLPLLTALTLLIGARMGMRRARVVSLTSLVLLLGVELYLLQLVASDTITLYALGNWPPPFGIVLQLDRLAALMLAMTGVLALFCTAYAACDRDGPGDSLHPLIHFLMLGLNGAFLTGDLFNLFVFFEVLLLASYALLLHGDGPRRAKAGLHYVVLNLAGSALFLIAVSLLYGVTGTLNMADMGARVAALDPADRPLAHTGGLLLFVVFGLKAAIAPLYFWLPGAYAAAVGPVAALFAVMTKVGIYSIVRVYGLAFSEGGAGFAEFFNPWLWPLAIVTLGLGVAGTLAARGLRQQIAYLVIVSVGTLLLGIAMNSVASLAALLYYLVHSTWICAVLFLLADVLLQQRGTVADTIAGGPRLLQGTSLGILFFIAAASVVGMPPTSGFVGKVGLMQAAASPQQVMWVWPALLLSGLFTITALSRSGSTFFWRTEGEATGEGRANAGALTAIGGLLALSIVLSFAGGWVLPYMEATAVQLADPEAYRQAASAYQPIRGNSP